MQIAFYIDEYAQWLLMYTVTGGGHVRRCQYTAFVQEVLMQRAQYSLARAAGAHVGCCQ